MVESSFTDSPSGHSKPNSAASPSSVLPGAAAAAGGGASTPKGVVSTSGSADACTGAGLACLDALAGVAGVAAISLAVAGILVMNVMLVAVTQRTGEIGLLKALGARGRDIRMAFLTEAALLSLAGAIAGFALGHLGAWAIRLLFPVLPAWPPPWAVVASLATALITGLLFGVMPARRAARLDPVQALMKR